MNNFANLNPKNFNLVGTLLINSEIINKNNNNSQKQSKYHHL